mmetsp:Transcript_6578/g.17660  ORF Transcript_6578/g.17660 Transcript_6578/m.17660 type:complete len:317 (+) Transcript_6578:92-1042(+)
MAIAFVVPVAPQLALRDEAPVQPHDAVRARDGANRWGAIRARRCSLDRSVLSMTSVSNDGAAIRAQHRALIFDCDGVILESEDLHRDAYNAAFRHFEVNYEWTPEYYDILQNTVGGGKPKMRYHFRKFGWPDSALGAAPNESEAQQNALIDALQDYKTEVYKDLVAKTPPRPGVLELMDAALDARDSKQLPLSVCICSASTKSSCLFTLDKLVGSDRVGRLDVVLAGDDVSKKKPDPLIYITCLEQLQAKGRGDLKAEQCVVIEDSLIGLQAAKGAGMKCLITTTSSTERQDFSGADAVYPNLAGVALDCVLSAGF